MKSVLLSIRPEWCERIASSKKTIEVRKTRPKLETPFKCYIYCQEGGPILTHSIDQKLYAVNGRVIGEFVCDCILEDTKGEYAREFEKESGLSIDEQKAYSPNGKLYGWHISDLKIYDELKALGEFKKINRDCWYADLGLAKRDCSDCKDPGCFVKRPPLSWCYVEELQ